MANVFKCLNRWCTLNLLFLFCFVNFIFYNVNHLQFVRPSMPANWSCSSVSKLWLLLYDSTYIFFMLWSLSSFPLSRQLYISKRLWISMRENLGLTIQIQWKAMGIFLFSTIAFNTLNWLWSKLEQHIVKLDMLSNQLSLLSSF